MRSLLRIALLASVLTLAATTADAIAALPAISISGHRFVAAGRTVQLRGVDEESTEYWCTFAQMSGYATYELGGEADEIATWGANAVRVPLNEDCWLGINGEPASQGATLAGYRQAIEGFVAALAKHGIYAILDLHYSANGSTVADRPRQMPDNHSAAFWRSVARTFRTNRGVIFDAFNEPKALSAADTGTVALPISWACWLKGGCQVSNSPLGQGQPSTTNTYRAVGMQALVTAIRSTGAHQAIVLGGLDWANDLRGWLSHEPKDPLRPAQLAASYHNYEGSTCASAACWNTTIASVARRVPILTGEFGQFSCTDPGFDSTWMDWADAHDVSYLAWAFVNNDGSPACGTNAYTPYLLKSDLTTPEAANGAQVYRHLMARAAAH